MNAPAVALKALGLGLLLLAGGHSVLSAGEVGYVVGTAEFFDTTRAQWAPLQLRQRLGAEDRLRIRGLGRVELRFVGQRFVRLNSGTEAQLRSDVQNATDPVVVELWAGQAWGSVSGKLRVPDALHIRTPQAVIAVKGTQFGVLLEPQVSRTEVSVFRGQVEVQPPSEVMGPREVPGPQEVAPPQEVSREAWVVLVREQQRLVIGELGIPRPEALPPQVQENDWVRFNLERDRNPWEPLDLE
ncbi:MAG: FecR domain-containing protein [SAR324 cluster bacterium]|nr:FecR domain-containing protein [SAR324 cluster bacterium]